MSSWIYFVTIEMLPFVVKRKMHRSYKLLLHEIPLEWLTWLDCDSEFSSVNGWHDTSTCSPLILCVFSVTFLASAKRKISFVPLFTNSNKACLIRRSHCNLNMYFFDTRQGRIARLVVDLADFHFHISWKLHAWQVRTDLINTLSS